MARHSIAYCPCGNVSVDGLNFQRVEGAGIPTLQCARCGATSTEFEYLNRSEVEPLIEAVRDVAISSLRYCELKYGHDDQARLNLEAISESFEDSR
jgi:hypothetical protein